MVWRRFHSFLLPKVSQLQPKDGPRIFFFVKISYQHFYVDAFLGTFAIMEKKTIWDMGRIDTARFHSMPKTPLIVVVDNVRSLNNIGSIFRTADAFAATRVVLCGICACPPSAEIHKTALGAEESVDWVYYADTLTAVRELKAAGWTVACIEQVKGSVMLDDFVAEANRKYAVVVGNEVDGVSQEVVDASDMWIEIPQSGTKHSLNVAVSAALAMWPVYVTSLHAE